MDNMTTKQKIMYAALELFSKKGYDGVGVDLIAETVGMKGPSLYRHFKGKEDLFNSLIDMVSAHYEEGLRHNVMPDAYPENMDELIEKAIEEIRFTMHDDIIQKVRRILAMEQFRSARMAELTSRYHLEKLQEKYAHIFRELMDKGIVKKYDANWLALEFVAPVSMLIHMYDRQPEREEEVLENIRKHFEHFKITYATKI